jgi:hypothetical protein
MIRPDRIHYHQQYIRPIFGTIKKNRQVQYQNYNKGGNGDHFKKQSVKNMFLKKIFRFFPYKQKYYPPNEKKNHPRTQNHQQIGQKSLGKKIKDGMVKFIEKVFVTFDDSIG